MSAAGESWTEPNLYPRTFPCADVNKSGWLQLMQTNLTSSPFSSTAVCQPFREGQTSLPHP